MAKRGWGRVQFVSSESALQIPAEGVTVNAVLPDPARSEGLGGFFGKIAAERGASRKTVERDFIAPRTGRPR
jgi:NAD(P)-dependent dehydrogenase (short-subunit alcohol dehydrogenase family)